MHQLFHELTDELLSLVFSPCCIVCNRPSGSKALCKNCSPVEYLPDSICQRCGYPYALNQIECGVCLKNDFAKHLIKTRSLLWMNDAARVILHRVKFALEYEFLELFHDTIRTVPKEFPKECVIVPVPISNARFWERGFNQSRILAEWLGEHLQMPVSVGLIKTRDTPAQSTLGKAARRTNLRASFEWNLEKIPEHILLVDDVFTTGATLETCAKVLKRNKVQAVYAWTLFRTPLRLA